MTDRILDFGDRGKVRVVADGQALAQAAAELFRETVIDAIEHRGMSTIALSGGTTPKAMGAILRDEPYRTDIPWGSLHIFWGDERWVPMDDPESNAGEAKRGYLDALPIPPGNIHPFPTSGDPVSAASIYSDTVLATVPGKPIPAFDLILLGMGDDGHTASLFPGTTALSVNDKFVIANPVAKLNTTRLTFSAPLINAARNVVFLAGGSGKADRLREVLEGLDETDRLPSQLIRPVNGTLLWIVDEAAAARLKPA
jgi:6-phosphogluconolactonase